MYVCMYIFLAEYIAVRFLFQTLTKMFSFTTNNKSNSNKQINLDFIKKVYV